MFDITSVEMHTPLVMALSADINEELLYFDILAYFHYTLIDSDRFNVKEFPSNFFGAIRLFLKRCLKLSIQKLKVQRQKRCLNEMLTHITPK